MRLKIKSLDFQIPIILSEQLISSIEVVVVVSWDIFLHETNRKQINMKIKILYILTPEIILLLTEKLIKINDKYYYLNNKISFYLLILNILSLVN